MGMRLPSSFAFPARLVSNTAFDAVSVAASGTAQSSAFVASYARKARVVIPSSGVDVTVSLEAFHGGSWVALTSYSAGVTGPQAIVDILDPQVRLTASNSGLAAESITAYLVLGV
jgi:hypothetical protein